MAKTASNNVKAITEPLYYITNQYNLREILSGGFIGSRESFDDKYYKDLLEESPGRIPLFTQPLEPSLFDKVNEHDPETSFAVVLEIDPSKIDRHFTEIQAGEKDGHIKPAGIAYTGALPLKSVSAIHFLSEEKLGEFEVRPYSNMPSRRDLYKVSPGLAQAPAQFPDILDRLKELPHPFHPTAVEFSSLDRVSGAITLCLDKSSGKEQSKQLLGLLEPGRKSRKADQIPAWFDLGLEKKSLEELNQLTDIDELVFASTVTVLHGYNLNTIGQKKKILEEIKQLVNTNPAAAEHSVTLEKSFAKIHRLLSQEDVFEPFKPSPGYDAIRGLLLFLMRPHHKALLSWNHSETNASQPVMLTALAYSGIVIGRKGLDTEFRPATTDLEIAGLIVSAVNRLAEQKKKLQQTASKATKGKSSKDSVTPQLARSATTVPAKLVASSSLDWKTVSEEVLNDQKENPGFLGSAVWLCREMGWKDCVTTVFSWSTKDAFLMQSGARNEVALKLSGFPEIVYELDFEQFKLYLSERLQPVT